MDCSARAFVVKSASGRRREISSADLSSLIDTNKGRFGNGMPACFTPCRRAHAGGGRARCASLAPIVLGPKEGLALLNGTQFSTAEALSSLFAIERVFQAALVTGALSTNAGEGLRYPVRPAHPGAARPSRADPKAPNRLRAAFIHDRDRTPRR